MTLWYEIVARCKGDWILTKAMANHGHHGNGLRWFLCFWNWEKRSQKRTNRLLKIRPALCVCIYIYMYVSYRYDTHNGWLYASPFSI
jgi:hypothetical protein